jgi:hypothetical protein
MPSDYSKLLASLEKELTRKKKELESEKSYPQSDISRSKEATLAQIRLQGLQEYYGMRKNWGRFLMFCLAVILIFNIGLVIAVGKGGLTYKDEWFLRIVLTTNLADIIGLVYLVVNFLFSNQVETDKSQLPKQ